MVSGPRFQEKEGKEKEITLYTNQMLAKISVYEPKRIEVSSPEDKPTKSTEHCFTYLYNGEILPNPSGMKSVTIS